MKTPIITTSEMGNGSNIEMVMLMPKDIPNLVPVWLPTASPEFMVLEESWNISKITMANSSRNIHHQQSELLDWMW
jgi:hypothetical protein